MICFLEFPFVDINLQLIHKFKNSCVPQIVMITQYIYFLCIHLDTNNFKTWL